MMRRVAQRIAQFFEGRALHVFDVVVTVLVVIVAVVGSGFTLASTDLTQTDDTTTTASPGQLAGGFNASNSATSSTVVYGTGSDAGIRLSVASNVSSSTQYLSSGTYNWVAPVGVTSVRIELWGGGGDGGDGTGGGGGAYAKTNSYSVTEGSSYPVSVGEAGADSYFGDTSTALAKGGQAGGSGGQAAQSIGDVKYSGDDGAGGGFDGSGYFGGSGGAGAGSGGPGTGGAGGAGASEYDSASASTGEPPGGGGGGGISSPVMLGSGGGAPGQAVLTYSIPTFSSSGVYKSYVDGGVAAPNWSSFRLTKGSTSSGAGTIAIKIKTSESNATPPTFNASGAACDFSVSTNGSSGAKDLTTCTNLGSARYLWYEATLSTADTSASPLLEEVVVSIANTAPTAPASLGPSARVDGSTTSDNTPDFSFTLSDTDAADTLRYQIQIDDAADFASPVVDYLSSLAAQGARTFTVGQAVGGGGYTTGAEAQTLADASYYWRVRAGDSTYATSSYTSANGGAVAFVVDTTGPVITLSGAASVSLTVGDSYADAGATAADAVGGDLTADIVTTGSVNTAAAGTYTLTYSVSDGVGNAATPVTRTVTVVAASAGSSSHSSSRTTAPAPSTSVANEESAAQTTVEPDVPVSGEPAPASEEPRSEPVAAPEASAQAPGGAPEEVFAETSESTSSVTAIRNAADSFVRTVVTPVQIAAKMSQEVVKETADVTAPIAAPLGLAAAATTLASGSVSATASLASMALFRFGLVAAVYLAATKPSLMTGGMAALYVVVGILQYVGTRVWRHKR